MRASSSPARTRIGAPQAAFGPGDEFRTIAGVAGRRRRHRFAQFDLETVRDHPKARQRFQRRGAAFGMQTAGRDHVAADGADRFFVLPGGGVAVLALIDHQAHRVGADIDDGNGTARVGGARARSGRGIRWRRQAVIRSGACGAPGPWIFSARPRPESEGLVMKYVCAEKASASSECGIARYRFRPPSYTSFAPDPSAARP